MPDQSPYIDRLYSAIKESSGSDFTKTPEQFSQLVNTDSGYRNKVYSAIKEMSGTDFTKTPEEFDNALGLKKKDTGNVSTQPSQTVSDATNSLVSPLEQQSNQAQIQASLGVPPTQVAPKEIPEDQYGSEGDLALLQAQQIVHAIKKEGSNIASDLGMNGNIGYPFESPKSTVFQNLIDNPAKQIEYGAKDALNNLASPTSYQGVINSNSSFGEKLGHALHGTGEAAMGSVGATGEGMAFNAALGTGEKLLPDQYMNKVMSPLSTIIKPETELGKTWAGVGDMAVGLLLFKGAEMAGNAALKTRTIDIADKIKSGEPLTPEETQTAQQVMQTVTEGDIQQAAQQHTAIEEMPQQIPTAQKVAVAPIHSEIKNTQSEISDLQKVKYAKEAEVETVPDMYKPTLQKGVDEIELKIKDKEKQIKELNKQGAEILAKEPEPAQEEIQKAQDGGKITLKDLEAVSDGSGLQREGQTYYEPEIMKDLLQPGDKVSFYAEKERAGIWDGKVIVDESGNKWGLLGILHDKEGWIQKVNKEEQPTNIQSDESEQIKDGELQSGQTGGQSPNEQGINQTEGANEEGLQQEGLTPEDNKARTGEPVESTDNNELNSTDAKERLSELEKQIFTKKGNLKKNIPEDVKKEYSALKTALEQNHGSDLEAKSKEGKEASKAETAKINEDFEKRQQELSKYVPENEQHDNAIQQKMGSNEPLTDEEVKYANDNFYKVAGYEFNKEGGLTTTPVSEGQPDKFSAKYDVESTKNGAIIQEYNHLNGKRKSLKNTYTFRNDSGKLFDENGEILGDKKSKILSESNVLNKGDQDVIQEQSTAKVDGSPQIGTNSKGDEHEGMRESEQGQKVTGESPKEEDQVEPRTVGVSHESLSKVANNLGLDEIQRGESISPEEYAKRGKLLIENGVNPEEVANDFHETGKVNGDMISVARAHLENLDRIAEDIRAKEGKDSPNFIEAKQKAEDWIKDVVKPMGSKFHEIGQSLQGETDIDTGSFIQMERAFKNKHGKDPSPAQQVKIEELSSKVKSLSDELAQKDQELTDKINKAIEDESAKNNIGKYGAKNKIVSTDKYKEALRSLRSKAFTGIPVEAFTIATYHIEAGAHEFGDFSKKMVKDLGIKIKPYLKDIYQKTVSDLKEQGHDINATPDNEIKSHDQILAGKEVQRLTDLRDKKQEKLDKGDVSVKDKKEVLTPEGKSLTEEIKELNKQISEKRKIVNAPTPLTPEEELENLQTQFVGKADSKFALDEVKSIWDYAKKEYLDKGSSFSDMLNGVSKELGLTRQQVLDAIRTPKTARKITDERYLIQSRRNSAVNKAKEYIEIANRSRIEKFLKAVPNFFFEKAIFGHGTVGMITHAGMGMFKPSMWKPYWRNFFKQFKFAFGGMTDAGLARYEQAIEGLQNDPQFAMWKRAGLKIDPLKETDDYSALKKFFGKISTAGDRGFDALKFYRLETAKQIYNRLSNAEKADPAVLKEIATQVNHSTGTSDVAVPHTLGVAIFAPRLIASRWSRLVVQPIKAINTFSKWSKATPAEKVAAKLTARNAGETMATYAALLAANQALLSVMGSKQQINFTDPSKSDWLLLKGADRAFDMSGGMVATTGFVAKLFETVAEDQKKLKGKGRDEKLFDITGKYIRGKLSPFASTAVDVATRHDYNGNTLPFSNEKPKNRFAHKMGWVEYLTQHQTPIPIADAFQSTAQSMKDRGMSNAQINDIMNGILDGVISGGSGVRVKEDKE